MRVARNGVARGTANLEPPIVRRCAHIAQDDIVKINSESDGACCTRAEGSRICINVDLGPSGNDDVTLGKRNIIVSSVRCASTASKICPCVRTRIGV